MPIRDLEQTVQQKIDACSDCYKSCVVTMQHCFAMSGKYADRSHINILKDCAEISKLTEVFMLHDSEFTKDISALCAQICDRCAEDCTLLDSEDAQLQSCAEFCKTCAAACRA